MRARPALVAALLALGLGAPSASAAPARWAAAWTTAMAGRGPQFTDQTLRMVLRPHLAGDRVRLRLSNRFSDGPVTIDGLHVGVRASGASVLPGTNRAVTVRGRRRVVLPRGGVLLTDPVDLRVVTTRDLAVSFHVVGRARLDFHPYGYRTSYATAPRTGAKGAATSGAGFGRRLVSGYALDAVDVRAAGSARTVVAFGDSITDGNGTRWDAERRWPDVLARRFAAAGRRVSVVNAGIAGNSLVGPAPRGRSRGAVEVFGRPGLTRFAHDALGRAGVTDVVVLLGINDLGDGSSAAAVIAGYRRLVAQAHARGVRVTGGTLLPAGDVRHGGPVVDAKRTAVNRWIRTAGVFDAVVDLDAALRDPGAPDRLRPAYDSGDHLHPNDAGARAIARAIDLATLARGG